MNVIPAIDLINGACVRLYQGQYQQKTVYEQDPVALAQHYQKQGAKLIHIVDLDGAKQKQPVQLELVKAMVDAVDVPVQFGGGIRRGQDIEDCLAIGIDKIVLGSLSIEHSSRCCDFIKRYNPETFVLALDVAMIDSQPIIATNAWEQSSGKVLWDVIAFYKDLGITDILCTDISNDGTLKGPNFELYQEAMNKFPSIRWQASGGVSSHDDLKQLAQQDMYGAIVGRALYEGQVELKSIIEELRC